MQQPVDPFGRDQPTLKNFDYDPDGEALAAMRAEMYARPAAVPDYGAVSQAQAALRASAEAKRGQVREVTQAVRQ